MVGMTRAQMAEPHLVRKIELGLEHTIRPCVGATYCLDRIYQAGEALCIHNAATGRELTMPHDIPHAARPRRVVIVGGGPGGLEAARVCGERGHDVVLLEAMPWTGGQIRLAARNPRRKDLLGIVEWRDAELARLGVDVRVDTYADEHVVGDLQPDVVIVATGGLPQNPDLEVGADLVVSAWDVVGGDARLSGDVMLYDDDGTHSAMTTAEMLARSGARLEIVTPERTVGVDVGGIEHGALRPGVQRDRHSDHVEPTGSYRSPRRRATGRRDRQRPLAGSAHPHRRRSRRRPRCAGQRRALPRPR